eukprot:2591988-Rhodomonas_salina.2
MAERQERARLKEGERVRQLEAALRAAREAMLAEALEAPSSQTSAAVQTEDEEEASMRKEGSVDEEQGGVEGLEKEGVGRAGASAAGLVRCERAQLAGRGAEDGDRGHARTEEEDDDEDARENRAAEAEAEEARGAGSGREKKPARWRELAQMQAQQVVSELQDAILRCRSELEAAAIPVPDPPTPLHSSEEG